MDYVQITKEEVDKCQINVEKAVAKFYLAWKQNSHVFFTTEFSYRIEEVVVKGEKYIRLRYGSENDRLVVYIGKKAAALYSLMSLRKQLCDKANSQLQKIVENSGELDLWFHKYPLKSSSTDKIQSSLWDFDYVIKAITRKTRQINPDADAMMERELENLRGFFIEEYPNPKILYKPLSIEIDLVNKLEFDEKLDVQLPKVLPPESTYSFTVEKLLGKYVWGKFQEKPYSIYFDIFWKNGFYSCRILNLAGFVKEKTKKSDNFGMTFSMQNN